MGFGCGAHRRPAQKFDNLEKFDMGRGTAAAFPALGIKTVGRGGQEEDRWWLCSVLSSQQLKRQRVIRARIEQVSITLELIENHEVRRRGIQSGLRECFSHPAQALTMFACLDRKQNVLAGWFAKFRAQREPIRGLESGGDIVELVPRVLTCPRPTGRCAIFHKVFRKAVGQAGVKFVEQKLDERALYSLSPVESLRAVE